MRSELSNRGLTNKLSMVVNVGLKIPLVVSGLSTRQPNSEIQDMILTVTKSEKIKSSWKRCSCVFNMMRIPFDYIAIAKKNSCTLKYNFNWTTAEQVEMGHHQWNGVLKCTDACSGIFRYQTIVQYQLNSSNSWHAEIPRPSPKMCTYTCMYSYNMQCKWA